MLLALSIFSGSALLSVEKWSQMQRSRISLSYLWFKFFVEGVNATTKQRERISKAVVKSRITTSCYFMIHSTHSYFFLSARRKEKALWRLKHASDLAKSIALGHEPPQKRKCKY